MLGWGSWANTQKLAGKEKWPFQLFYWDYAIGVFLFSILFAHTLGSSAGRDRSENLHAADLRYVLPALISGAIFNLSNILLVVGIDAAGMSVAFPVGVGLALVIGTVESYMETPKGNPALLFAGVALIVFAMVMSALAHKPPAAGRRRRSASRRDLLRHRRRHDGLLLSAVDALHLARLQHGTDPPGMLTPYVALLFFGAGVLASNFVWNTIFMRAGRRRLIAIISAAAPKLHAIGILGGVHLDAGAELQRDRIGRRRSRDLLRARPRRDPRRRDLGTLHLARIPRRARGHVEVPRPDARRLHHRPDPDRRRDADPSPDSYS